MALKNKSVFPVEEVHFTRIDARFLKNGKWLETRIEGFRLVRTVSHKGRVKY